MAPCEKSREISDPRRTARWKRDSSTHEERNEQVKTEGGSLGGRLSTGNQTSPSDVHGNGLSGGSNQEERSSTGAFNNDEGEQGEEGVDDGENSSEDKGELTADLDLILEKNGGVVNDSVASSELLVDLGRGTDNHSSQVLLLASDKHVLGRSLGLFRGVDGVHNVGSLLEGTGVVDRGPGQSGDNLETLIHVSVREQPSRRLRHDQGSPDDEEREEGLKGDRESPREGAIDLRLRLDLYKMSFRPQGRYAKS